jgi:hypothetical protein
MNLNLKLLALSSKTMNLQDFLLAGGCGSRGLSKKHRDFKSTLDLKFKGELVSYIPSIGYCYFGEFADLAAKRGREIRPEVAHQVVEHLFPNNWFMLGLKCTGKVANRGFGRSRSQTRGKLRVLLDFLPFSVNCNDLLVQYRGGQYVYSAGLDVNGIGCDPKPLLYWGNRLVGGSHVVGRIDPEAIYYRF